MIRSLLSTLVALLAVTLAGHSPAAGAQPADARGAWVQATAPGQQVAGAYLELVGRERSALIGVASPVAGRAELHESTVQDGVMRMRPVARVELDPGRPVRLAPGGLHIMLSDLKRPLKAGERVPLTLTVERPDSSRAVFTVQAEVRAAAPGSHGSSHKSH